MSSDENLAYFTRVLDLNQSFFGLKVPISELRCVQTDAWRVFGSKIK